MEKYAAELLHLYNIFRMFLISSITQAKAFKESLENKIKNAQGKIKEALAKLIADVEYWIDLAEELLAHCILLGKRIGISVEKFIMRKSGAKEDVLRLIQEMKSILKKVQETCLECVGRGVFLKIKEHAKELLSHPENLEDSEEIEQIIKEFKEMDAFIDESKEKREKIGEIFVEG